MLYRIVIKTTVGGKLYYLSSDNDCPETDSSPNLDTIQFLSNLNTTHAHTFSSEEKAQEIINSLPYPYNEKAILLAVKSVSTVIVSRLYYRVAKKQFNSNTILWANSDKSFTEHMTPETLLFETQEESEEFIQSLVGLKKRYSFVVKIKDYGEPDYKFDAEFLIRGKTIYNKSEVPGIIKLK